MNVTMNVKNGEWPGGNSKVAGIKAIRNIMGLGLKEAKDLIEDADTTVGGVGVNLTCEQIKEFRAAEFTINNNNDTDGVRDSLKRAAIMELEADNFEAATEILQLLNKNYGV